MDYQQTTGIAVTVYKIDIEGSGTDAVNDLATAQIPLQEEQKCCQSGNDIGDESISVGIDKVAQNKSNQRTGNKNKSVTALTQVEPFPFGSIKPNIPAQHIEGNAAFSTSLGDKELPSVHTRMT